VISLARLRTLRALAALRSPRSRRVGVCVAALIAAAALISPAATAARSDALHKVGFPTYMKGTVVDPASGDSVRGVRVTVRDPVTLDLIGSDVTDVRGVFRIGGLHSDEYAIKFNGARRGYETGFGGCLHGVVATYPEACTFAPGAVGKFRLEHL
jgi:hypothetical protein